MDVILLERVRNLGEVGEKVRVRGGYGRNYLVPKGIAAPATPQNIARYEAQKAELQKVAAERLAQAKESAEKLASISLVLAHRAGAAGKLFGAVTGREIVAELERQGIAIDRSLINLPNGPIRLVGEHQVEVHLHPDVVTVLTVTVEAEAG